MQIILREDVNYLGKRGDVVKVADGYARNFLIPKRLAYRMTAGVRKQIESESRSKSVRDARERGRAEDFARLLAELSQLRFQRKSGETGSLFGSVTNMDIAEELKRRGADVDRRSIRLDEPIKRLGTHRVTIHLHEDVEVGLVIEVEAESSG